MDYEKLIASMTPDTYNRLKTAIEMGKWPNGVRLTEAQLELCMEAVLRWQIEHLEPQQYTGYMANRCAAKKP